MYAYFSVSENKLRQFRTQYGSIDKMISQMPEVGLQLNDGTFYGRKGRIETVSGVVNATTGAVQIKARFPNPDRELLSGTIGNVVLQGVDADAILLPKTAPWNCRTRLSPTASETERLKQLPHREPSERW